MKKIYCLVASLSLFTAAGLIAAPSIVVSVPDQTLALVEGGVVREKFSVSTSKFGLGDNPNSYATPLGSLEIASKIGDRKSTRLNSSHLVISYAVFCLKKKKHSRDRALRTCTRRAPLTSYAFPLARERSTRSARSFPPRSLRLRYSPPSACARAVWRLP